MGWGGGCNPKKTERFRKFQIWDWFFSVFLVFFSVFPFWSILTGLTGSCLVVLVGYNSFYNRLNSLHSCQYVSIIYNVLLI